MGPFVLPVFGNRYEPFPRTKLNIHQTIAPFGDPMGLTMVEKILASHTQEDIAPGNIAGRDKFFESFEFFGLIR